MPARILAEVHLPGTDASRHLNATLENWSLTACVGPTSAVCTGVPRELPTEARTAMLQIWWDVHRTPRCEPEGIFPGDRIFRLSYLGRTYEGRLPASESDIERRNEGPCRAHARMAWWFARQAR
jgi:hypothetical protein